MTWNETLGKTPRPNVIKEITEVGLWIETERSRTRGDPQLVPAWMFNIAWGYLVTHGELSNRFLLDELNVKRSSAVCAILAQLPGVSQVLGRKILLRYQSPS